MDDKKASDGSLMSLSGKIETSQQRAGEHHLAEGPSDGSGSMESYGSEGSPSGVTTDSATKSPFKTTANLRGDLSLAEGE